MKRKIATLMLATMAVSSLTGCSLFEKTTAEGLAAKGLTELANAESMEMNMSMDVALKAALEDSLTMDMGLTLSGDIELEDTTSHADLDVAITVLGMNFEEAVEIWSKTSNDTSTTYTKIESEDVWSVTEEDAVESDSRDVKFETEDVEKIFSNLELQEREKGEDYVVTATLEMDDLVDMLEDISGRDKEDAEEVLSAFEELGIDSNIDLEFDMEMIFDAKNKNLTDLNLAVSGDYLSDEEVEVTKFDIDMKFKSINEELDLAIPKKVKENAIDESEYTGSMFDSMFDSEIEPDIDVDIDIPEVTPEVVPEVTPEVDNPTTEVVVGGDEAFTGNWYDLQMKIDGVMYTIPFDYDKLVDAGYSFNLADYGYEKGYILNPGDKVTGTIEITHPKFGTDYDSFAPWIGFLNTGDEAKDITECDVWSMQLDIGYGSRIKDNHPEIELINGITWGSTGEELKATFGEPKDYYRSDSLGYDSYTFYYRDEANRNDIYAKFTVYDEFGLTSVQYQVY